MALLIHSLDGGGAERVVADLANAWSAAGRSVQLITLDDGRRDRYEVAAAVRRTNLGMVAESHSVWQAIRNNRQRVAAIRTALRDSGTPLAISFVDRMNVLTLLAARRLPELQTVVCERTDFRHHSIGRVWSWQRDRLYPHADRLVVQSDELAEAAGRWLAGERISVIPNAIAQWALAKTPQVRDGSRRTITWIGRMSPEKGVDKLLDAFARCAPRLDGWRLQLVGDGEQRAALEQLATSHGIAERVDFLGWQQQLSEVHSRTEVFVLPSDYEGFPNALIECMAQGIPSISFDCPSGPRAIIQHDRNGLLVPPGDVEQLAESIVSLAQDPDRIRRLSQAAAAVRTRYGREAVLAAWDNILSGRHDESTA